MKRLVFLVALFAAFSLSAEESSLVRNYIQPTRIMIEQGSVINSTVLLREGDGQSILGEQDYCKMKSLPGSQASLVLDFGREMQGGIRIVTGMFEKCSPRVRIRFGESVSEACCDIDGENGASNDHAIRDFEATLPWLGVREFGNSGFRFVRIDLLDEGVEVLIKEVNAVSIMSPLEYVGSFKCADERLNKIWETAAYTVHLNVQDYVWDGIKRDRLVWMGDMHPEVMTICNVFGNIGAVPRSLDLVRDTTPLPGWMNGISSYSIWWIMVHYEWYMHNGDKQYLLSQREYMTALLRQILDKVDENGREHMEGRFLDWPSHADEEAMCAGFHALMTICIDRGAVICDIMGEDALAKECRDASLRLHKAALEVISDFASENKPFTAPGRKQAVALLRLSGLWEGEEVSRRLLEGGAQGFSTFYGYYMLEALAKERKYSEAVSLIENYWGGMLDLGATSFWEDFDMAWLENAGRIDEFTPEGKIDVHRSYGGYCYQGYRHSFCHGWASGPASWLIRHIAGLRPLSASCKDVLVDPHPMGLGTVSASIPTPYGPVYVKTYADSGHTEAWVSAPKEVRLHAGEGVRLRKL